MWDAFISLFTGMDAVPAILLLVGLVLCIIEICVPGLGIFGALGAISVVAGIIVRISAGGSVEHFFIMLFIIIIILGGVFLIAIHSAKSGLLSKSPLVTNSTAVSADYGSPENNFGKLLGKEGVLACDCRPVGRVKIGEEIYEVTTKSEFLKKDTRVKVVEVEGATIVVKAI